MHAFWYIKIILLSVIFIFLVHHLISYFTTVLTTPKIKDFVHAPLKKYQEIDEILESKKKTTFVPSFDEDKDSMQSMKDELKQFLKSKQDIGSTGLGSTGLGSTGLGSTGLGSTGLGLGSTSLDQIASII